MGRSQRVIPEKQAARFSKYIADNHIKTIKQFWHGSKNENWLSIVENGLSLNPHAAITGKMLGNGIYFAPSSLKSWNYTSHCGCYWTNGSSQYGIMGLYATAYGKPYDATNDIRQYTASELARGGYNCVHAKGGNGCYLRNDEVVYFSESAMCLNYIVVFE